MTKIHRDGIATEFVPRNFFSIWVVADDKHAQFRDKVVSAATWPHPVSDILDSRAIGNFWPRREESSGIDKTTLFACTKIRDLNLFSPL